jgi:23S rRNA (guanosine2251-2'-O)-methyltransferase
MQYIYGFHAILARIKKHPHSIKNIWINQKRQDKRMQQLIDILNHHKITYTPTEIEYLNKLISHTDASHQGVIAQVEPIYLDTDMNSLLDKLEQQKILPHLLILDGITDPHNLGACFRVADGAGVHAIIAPKDNSVNINATVSKVASGATEHIPYLEVTNLARCLNELKERGIWLFATSDQANYSLYDEQKLNLNLPLAWVMGNEGLGIRKNIISKCDFLVSIPMCGVVSSLNISVATGLCLYETLRRRSQPN